MRSSEPALTVPRIETVARDIALSAGSIRVREIGTGPTLLFVHGLLIDGRVWDSVVSILSTDFRCVIPDLPLGAHRTPLNPDASIDPETVALMLEELADAMDLDEVTVVAHDSGGAITQFWMDRGAPRVARVVLAPCDCFSNLLPPAFAVYQAVARVPGLLRLTLQLARARWVRHSSIAYGSFTHRPVDDALLTSWLEPALTDPAIARDAQKFLCGISSSRLTAAEERLDSFDRPVLLAWAPEQEWFPIEDARRLEAILPDARLLEIPGSGAFVALEQPEALARAIRDFAELQP